MRLFLFANNRVAAECVRWLRGRGEDIVGVALHPEERRKHGDEILEAAGVPPGAVFDGSRLREPEVLEAVAALRPQLGLSLLFDYILRPPLLELFPAGVMNLHPSLLPYNRGQYPNVWSIVEGTPSGVTLHWIDAGVDTGDLIAQREVPVVPEDTGQTLYRKLEVAGIALFQEMYPTIRDGTAPRRPQLGGGTYHRTRDVERIDEIDLDRSYRAGELIDILRARTFPPYCGAWFRAGNRRIYLRLELSPEDDPSSVDEAGG